MTPYSFIIPPNDTNTATSTKVVNVPIGSTASITIGHNKIVRIVGAGSVNMRAGSTGTTVATASDALLVASNVEYFDMGRQNEVLSFFNPSGAASVNVWITPISRV